MGILVIVANNQMINDDVKPFIEYFRQCNLFNLVPL